MIKSNYKLLIDQDDNQQINRAKAVARIYRRPIER